MSWLRVASGWWVPPSGAAIKADSHAVSAFEIIVDRQMRETGKNKADVMLDLMSHNITPDDSFRTPNKLIDEGYIRITDVGALGGASHTATAKTIADIIKAEEGLRPLIESYRIYVSANDGKCILDPDDLAAATDEAKSFSDYVKDAVKIGVSGSLLSWSPSLLSIGNRCVRFFR